MNLNEGQEDASPCFCVFMCIVPMPDTWDFLKRSQKPRAEVSAQETEAGGSQVHGQSELCSVIAFSPRSGRAEAMWVSEYPVSKNRKKQGKEKGKKDKQIVSSGMGLLEDRTSLSWSS